MLIDKLPLFSLPSCLIKNTEQGKLPDDAQKHMSLLEPIIQVKKSKKT